MTLEGIKANHTGAPPSWVSHRSLTAHLSSYFPRPFACGILGPLYLWAILISVHHVVQNQPCCSGSKDSQPCNLPVFEKLGLGDGT